MKKKVVLFSQIDPLIHEKLADRFELQVIQPKQGDVEQQLLEYSGCRLDPHKCGRYSQIYALWLLCYYLLFALL